MSYIIIQYHTSLSPHIFAGDLSLSCWQSPIYDCFTHHPVAGRQWVGSVTFASTKAASGRHWPVRKATCLKGRLLMALWLVGSTHLNSQVLIGIILLGLNIENPENPIETTNQ